MKFCLYVNQVTPHLVPLAREMVNLLGENEVRYVYDRPLDSNRAMLGWLQETESWVINLHERPQEAKSWILGADILICERRDIEVWRARITSGKGLYYTSERWYKPIILGRIFGHDICLSGMLRLLHPGFLRMAFRIARLFQSGKIVYLADGIYAAHDFMRTLDVLGGRWWRLIGLSRHTIEPWPFGIFSGHPKIVNWGYFVEPHSSVSYQDPAKKNESGIIHVLWAGRCLHWKRVDTLIKAVGSLEGVRLNLYGTGPMEARLRKLAARFPQVKMFPPVPYGDVRNLMRQHDVYVLPSNEWEGWGAVVNEALEEGMVVLGSHEAGASRAILPNGCRFHCWDWKELARLIESKRAERGLGIGKWSVKNAARIIYERS